MTQDLRSERTQLRREHHKGRHDRDTVHRILDDNPFCCVAFNDDEHPFVMPTMQWRVGDTVYWHGSTKGRLVKLCSDRPTCLTTSRINGLVLARSAYEHSVNFESVVVVGRAAAVVDPAEKLRLLERFFERMFPGRWAALRAMSEMELKATAVVGLDIREASAKVRYGPPSEPEEDRTHPVWAGILPMETAFGMPIPDAFNTQPVPEYIRGAGAPRSAGAAGAAVAGHRSPSRPGDLRPPT